MDENARLVCTSSATPTSAAPSPARKVRVGRWRRKIHAARVTKIDARFASRVAFATDVSWTDLCQKARSPAKASAAPTIEAVHDPQDGNRQGHAPERGRGGPDTGGQGLSHEDRRQRDEGGARQKRRQRGIHGPRIVRVFTASLFQVVPALERGVVALARKLHFLFEEHLAASVLLAGARAARGGALDFAWLQLDALVATRFGVLQRERRAARLFVGLVKLLAAVLRIGGARGYADRERNKNNG